jgi:hypothetical protein
VRIGKLWGYIDKQGAMMIAPRFDSASSFSGGLGLVSADGLFGYVDRTGSFAIRPQFNHAESSADGRAWAISHPVNGTSIIAVSKLSPENSLREFVFQMLGAHKDTGELPGNGNIHTGTFAYINVTGRVVFKYKS